MTAFTHIALRVSNLRDAETYYIALFGLRVVFREAPVDGTWKTFRSLAAWDRPGLPAPQMASLANEFMNLALGERDTPVDVDGPVDHIGLALDAAQMANVRQQARAANVRVKAERDDLFVFIDANGIQWELSSAAEPLQSNGQRRGVWIDG
jgi:catechol 2,3-dioxygenase-like lactoylglutathione lyase family enzyme